MRGISTRGQAAGNPATVSAQKNTRQCLSRSADSPRVNFLRSEKPGERGGAPNSAEIYTRARKGHMSRMLIIVNIRGNLYTRVKGTGPPAGKTYTQKLPQRGAGLFPTLPAISSKGVPLCHAGAPRRPATAIYKALQAICPATLYRPTGEPAPPAMGMF